MTDAKDPNQEPGGSEAFGFAPAAKDEKYNTQYLVSHMNKEKRVTQFIVLGGLALALGVVTWMLLAPNKEHAAQIQKAPEGMAAHAPGPKAPGSRSTLIPVARKSRIASPPMRSTQRPWLTSVASPLQ